MQEGQTSKAVTALPCCTGAARTHRHRPWAPAERVVIATTSSTGVARMASCQHSGHNTMGARARLSLMDAVLMAPPLLKVNVVGLIFINLFINDHLGIEI